MRIQFITPARTRAGDMHIAMCDVLRHGLCGRDDIQLVDGNPDIVHVFGRWDRHHVSLVRKLRARGLPVLFTCADGFAGACRMRGRGAASLSQRLCARSIARHGACIHVGGRCEESIVRSMEPKALIMVMASPLMTASTDIDSFLDNILYIYNKVCKESDEMAREAICNTLDRNDVTQPVERLFVQRLLYLAHLYKKGCIPQSFLDETVSFMVSSDYDEEEARNILHKLKIFKYASQCMHLLAETSSLTEGFMPVRSKNGKDARKMKALVINDTIPNEKNALT